MVNGLETNHSTPKGEFFPATESKDMENRLRECGGIFSIENKPHEGTTVTLCIPLKEKLNTYHE